MKNRIFLLIILNALCISIKAQHHRLKDVQTLTFTDYTAARPAGSPRPVYTNVRIYYRLDSVVEQGENDFKLKLITKVVANPGTSYFDRSGMSAQEIKIAQAHEQGHLLIGYIIANRLEGKISKMKYSKKYAEEVKAAFYGDDNGMVALREEYDRATKNGRNKKEQQQWEKKLQEMFEQSF